MLKRIIVDISLWVISAVICILWRVLADKESVWPYILLFAVMMVVWILVGIVARKYRSYKILWAWQEFLSMAIVALVEVGLIYGVMPYLPWALSQTVAYWMVGIVAAMDALVILVLHYWKYATNMNVPVMEIEQRENAVVGREDEERSQASKDTIHQMSTLR